MATLTSIDFESIPDDNTSLQDALTASSDGSFYTLPREFVITDQYADDGVIFSRGTEYDITGYPPGSDVGGDVGLGAYSNSLPANIYLGDMLRAPGSIRADFTVPVTYVYVDLPRVNSGYNYIARAYNSSDQLIATSTTTPDDFTKADTHNLHSAFLEVQASENISYILWDGVEASVGISIDNLTFGDLALEATQDVIRKHGGLLNLSAELSMAAYRLDRAGGERELWGFNHRDGARDDKFDELRDDFHFLGSDDLNASVGTQTSTEFPRAGLEDGIYTNLNAAALVARTDDALFLSFRGTNDNTNDYGWWDIAPETPDGDHWVGKDDHWALFEPLMTALKSYLQTNGEITDVFISGHSLGAAMVEAFMDDMAGTKFHANTFASPGYGVGLFTNDQRVTNLWIEDDPILRASFYADNNGDKNYIIHNLFDDGHLDADTQAAEVHRIEYYQAFTQFMSDHDIGIEELSGKALFGKDFDFFYMNAVPTGDLTSITVGGENDKILGDRRYVDDTGQSHYDPSRDVLLGGGGDDVLRGGSYTDYLDGGSENDELYGGRGKDYLNGGSGNDILTGGKHTDFFIFERGWGVDTILDFDARGGRHDTIDLSAVSAIRGWNDLNNNHLSISGNDVLIRTNAGNTIVLDGVNYTDLDKGDFLF